MAICVYLYYGFAIARFFLLGLCDVTDENEFYLLDNALPNSAL